jgi:hypothetical protein
MKKNIRDRIILELKKKKEVTLWDLSRLGLFNDVIKTVNRMEKNGLLTISSGNIKLTPKAKRLFKKFLSFKIDKNFEKKYRLLRKDFTFKKYDPFNLSAKYDQLLITTGSVLSKLNFVLKNGDILNRKIVCIGDDDMFGICLALTGLPREVLVVDIDERIVNYETEVSKNLKVKINGLLHDLREPIPKKFKKKFDVFITEPPDTLNGLTLFFSRGSEFLKGGGVAYIGVGKCNISLKTYHRLQENILRMGFTITDILSNFIRYTISGDELTGGWPEVNFAEWVQKPRKPWFKVDLLRAESFGKIKPLIKGYYSKDITTYLQK